MPAHNAEPFIFAAIQSVLHQTYENYELWVLENGSTDGTLEIAQSVIDPRVKVFDLGPVGIRGAIDFAIQNASSEWIARMDADDIILPKRLQIQMDFLHEHPNSAFVGTNYLKLTPFGHVFVAAYSENPFKFREITKERLFRGKEFADASVVFNRKLAQRVGVDHEFERVDTPLWFRLFEHGKAWQLEQPLYIYRMQPSSVNSNPHYRTQRYDIRKKYTPDLIDSGLVKPMETVTKHEITIGFWKQVALYELLMGEYEPLRIIQAFLRSIGSTQASRVKLYYIFHKLAYGYYSKRVDYRVRRYFQIEDELETLIRSTSVDPQLGIKDTRWFNTVKSD